MNNRRTKAPIWSIKFILFSLLLAFFSVILGLYAGLHLSQWNTLDLLLAIMPQNQILPAENILVIGIDDVKDSKRSDTIMVININKSKHRVGVLSVPRDTYVELPKRGFTKINHAYAYGGVSMVKSAISRFLQIPITYYVVVDVKGVKEIVDRIGGVSVEVKKRLHYIDRAGNLFIDFEPGKQVLDGDQSIAYLRFRHDNQGDIGRIKRQQEFMQAMAQKVITSKQILKLPQLIQDINKYVDTNLNVGQMFNLGLEIKDALQQGHLKVNTIPGSIVLIKGVSYWKVDLPAAVKMINETIHGFNETEIADKSKSTYQTELGTAKKLTMTEVSTFMPKEEISPMIFPEGETIVVEVLNGNGIEGNATRMARYLKSKNIKVPRIGNAAHYKYPQTIIVDWKGKTVEALTLAKALNINPGYIITYYKPKKPLDITLVLGHDWEQLTIDR